MPATRPSRLAIGARWLLGLALAGAGTGHLTVAREEFQAQVPSWVPLDPDLVVLGSGVAEIALGLGLLAPVSARRQRLHGWLAAAFFVAIFPGNVAQYLEGRDGFGLDTDQARLTRLFFQPVLVAWALWSTGAWRAWRDRRAADDTDTDDADGADSRSLPPGTMEPR